MSFLDDKHPGPFHIQQEKDPNAPDLNRTFDGLDTRLSEALISAAIASADQELARKEAEAAALAAKVAAAELAARAAAAARAATYLSRSERRAKKAAASLPTSCAPCAPDSAPNGATPASDGGSSTEGLSFKISPAREDESLRYVTIGKCPAERV